MRCKAWKLRSKELVARARAWGGRVLTVREDLAVFGEVSAILPAKVIMINPWNYNSLNRAAKKR